MIDEGEEYVGEDIVDIYEEKELDNFFEDEEINLKQTSSMRGYDEDYNIKEKVGRCKSCGHEIDLDDKICNVCGEILERLSESAYG